MRPGAASLQVTPTMPEGYTAEALKPRYQSLESGIRSTKASMPEPRSRVIAPLGHRYQNLDSGNTTPKAPSHHPKGPNARASGQGNRSPTAPMPEAGVGKLVLLGCRCRSQGSGNERVCLGNQRFRSKSSPNTVGSMVLHAPSWEAGGFVHVPNHAVSLAQRGRLGTARSSIPRSAHSAFGSMTSPPSGVTRRSRTFSKERPRVEAWM